MRALGLCASFAASHSLRRVIDIDSNVDNGADAGMDDEGSAGVWLPIHPTANETFFYNPSRGISMRQLPRGAVTTVAVQVNKDTPVEKVNGTIVPLDKRLSCVPHCAWSCSSPVCEQNCKPQCGVPQCETRCPKANTPGAFEGCKVKCGEPNCAMFCPADPCGGKKTLDCNTPKCSTKCEEPKCSLDCSASGKADMGCKTVCPDPICQWHCQKPKSCPHPVCKMICEQPPECGIPPGGAGGGQLAIPPPQDGYEKVGSSKSAVRAQAKWEVASWSACSSTCGTGTEHRRVVCNAGDESQCGTKPDSERECESYKGCEYTVGQWSDCSERCGPGQRTRHVQCDGVKCEGDKPPSTEECIGRAETCDECKVTIWGGRDFNGWEKTFGIGNYSAAELEYQGVKCDDVSSLEVIGDFCEMKSYEFGDFNKLHNGWTATFRQGKFDVKNIESAGARNNDISSFRVYRWDTDGKSKGHGKEHGKTSTSSASHKGDHDGASGEVQQTPAGKPHKRNWKDSAQLSSVFSVAVVYAIARLM